MIFSHTNSALIDEHKENIQPLTEGRSVSKLATNFKNASNSFQRFKDEQYKQKESYEEQIKILDELDDPLQLYIDYIRWTHENFPQGSNAQSGLLSILEGCTSHFRDTSFYKNDPRYLKVWLEYSNYSDAPKDIFVYLAKKHIGTKLALYYEEFAKYLELTDKINDAKSIYELGIKSEARPLSRLQRNYDNFIKRNFNEEAKTEENISRPGLSISNGDSVFPLAHNSEDDINPRKKPKIHVLSDESNDRGILESIFESSPVDTNELGSIRSRIKENVILARPWIGEKISQKATPEKVQKIHVFKDDIPGDIRQKIRRSVHEPNGLINTLVSQKGRASEKVFINMELLYPSTSEEYSIDELFALTRKQRGICLSKRDTQSNEALQRGPPLDLKQPRKSPSVDKRFQLDHTLTIPIKDENSEDQSHPCSPTVTVLSNMAHREVIGMFNRVSQGIFTDDEEERIATDLSDNYDGFVTETMYPSVSTSNQHGNDTVNAMNEVDQRAGNGVKFKGPKSKAGSDVVNPLDLELRIRLLSSLPVPLESYPGFHNHESEYMKKFKILEGIVSKQTKNNLKGMPESVIRLGGEAYCLRNKLGDGGFGAVYLVETEKGVLKALKVEIPSSPWEFYILTQIQRRVDMVNSALFAIPESLYYFKDESFMVMQYYSQGTILDVVNRFHAQDKSMDEVLCVFLTIGLIKAVETLHYSGIIHTDLKADNCMIRFHPHNSVLSDRYSRHDSMWLEKSITLIDFGRAVDVNLFDKKVAFLSDWKANEQDCVQMRRGQPWGYEADYYGLAGIIHTMLFGSYMKITESNDGYISLRMPFKRYWQVDIWSRLFSLLLNPYRRFDDHSKGPIIDELQCERYNLEEWLERNSDSKNLKNIVYDLEKEIVET